MITGLLGISTQRGVRLNDKGGGGRWVGRKMGTGEGGGGGKGEGLKVRRGSWGMGEIGRLGRLEMREGGRWEAGEGECKEVPISYRNLVELKKIIIFSFLWNLLPCSI